MTFEINVCVKFDTRRKKKSRKFFPFSSQIFRKRYSQMSAIFLSQVRNVFLSLKSNFKQTLFSNIGNFFISSRKFFPSSLVKCYANVILKYRQFFYLKSEMFSFVSSQLLRKRYSQISAIFFYLKSEMFSFISSRDEGKNFGLKIKKIADV